MLAPGRAGRRGIAAGEALEQPAVDARVIPQAEVHVIPQLLT